MLPLRVVIVAVIVFVQFIRHTEESEPKAVLVCKEEFVDFPENGLLDENVPWDEAPCCTTGACTCHSLLHALANLTDNVLINITTDVVLSSIAQIVSVKNVVISGYRNPTVYCNNTGGVKFITSGYITIDGIIWNGCGFSNITNMLHSHPGLGMENSFNITVKNCTFINSTGQAIEILNVMDNVMVTNCVFINNILYAVNYIMNDSAIHYLLSLTIDNCTFRENGRVFSVVHILGHSSNIMPISICNSTFVDNQATSINITSQSIHLCGFITFKGNKGSAITISKNSYLIFPRNSFGIFHNNTNGAIFSTDNSTIVFENNSKVRFSENSRTNYGGGAVYSFDKSKISFKGNCTVTFAKNSAILGGALYSDDSAISFENYSTVTFTDNSATWGGTIGSVQFSSIHFAVNATVIFAKSSAKRDGGAIHSAVASNIFFKDYSTVTFTANTAKRDGGGISCDSCNIFLLDKCKTNLSNNYVTRDGGALHATHGAVITFRGHASVRFDNNKASRDGGAISYAYNSIVLHEDYSSITFSGNIALRDGGGASFFWNSYLLSTGHSAVTFVDNRATSGGALHCDINTGVLYKENVTVKFINNLGKKQGGAVYTNHRNNFTYDGNSTISYVSNKASSGGAIYSDGGCDLAVRGNSTVLFIQNIAVHGGAIYSGNLANSKTVLNGIINSTDASLSFKGNSSVTFKGNTATSNGGAVFTLQSNMKIAENVVVKFHNNTAASNGGALYLSDHTDTSWSNNSDVTFSLNVAEGYGGAVFIRIVETKVTFSANVYVQFLNNSALVSGNSLYINVPKSCNRSCFSDSVIGINNLLHHKQFGKRIAVTPHKLELYHPAVCIDNATKGDCEIYHVGNTMLGQKLSVGACPLDYYGQHSNGVKFTVGGEDDDDYFIDGESDVLISCGDNIFQGVSILGNETLQGQSSNFSIMLQLNVGPYSDERIFSIEVIVEISPCYPGFFHDKELQKCMCYNNTDIVFCSGSSSTIKRGYWYGSVNRQPTVAVCPVNNCDFTCCETTDGFYHLSPARENQCRAHRSGTACGDCEEGWTLSFDSAECVPVGNCTAGQTALIVVLSIIYWIGVVVAGFFMMYFKVPIGYLYAISYYYSLLDVWLNQTLHLSQSLLTTFNVLSSIVKVNPQFLGQLCLVPGMNEIDQQFIHYVHPLAISLILIAISLLARASYKFSSFISRGIIHVVCLLLLLSYTSIASTSLLLMRALTFVGIDKVYTYLSPDVEYFHGRHLPYVIVAILFTIVIVIGLPLLLLLQPFLNPCIDFIRIKPLLDQFQRCYKEKFYCFAAYYMMGRLIIITIVIAGSPTTSLVAYYIMIGTCVVMAIVHFIVRPYRHSLLNNFDGVMLMLLLIVANLPLFDTLSVNVTVVILFVFLIIPLPMFPVMILLSCKRNIKGFFYMYYQSQRRLQ